MRLGEGSQWHLPFVTHGRLTAKPGAPSDRQTGRTPSRACSHTSDISLTHRVCCKWCRFFVHGAAGVAGDGRQLAGNTSTLENASRTCHGRRISFTLTLLGTAALPFCVCPTPLRRSALTALHVLPHECVLSMPAAAWPGSCCCCCCCVLACHGRTGAAPSRPTLLRCVTVGAQQAGPQRRSELMWADCVRPADIDWLRTGAVSRVVLARLGRRFLVRG